MNAAQALNLFFTGKQRVCNTGHVDWFLQDGESATQSEQPDGTTILFITRTDGTATVAAYDLDNERMGEWDLVPQDRPEVV